MGKGDTVIGHPAEEEIKAKLMAGISVREVESWLKSKYSSQPRYWRSYMTLQFYRDRHLNIKGELLKEIQQDRQVILHKKEEERKEMIVKQSESYIATKKKLAEDLIDYENEIVQIHDKIWNQITLMENQPTHHLNARAIKDLLSEARALMMDYTKHKEDMNKGEEQDIAKALVQANSQLKAIKESIRDILGEIDPKVAAIFMNKLRQRLSEIKVTVSEE